MQYETGKQHRAAEKMAATLKAIADGKITGNVTGKKANAGQKFYQHKLDAVRAAASEALREWESR